MNPASPNTVPAWAAESRPDIDGMHHTFIAPTAATAIPDGPDAPAAEVVVTVVQIDHLQVIGRRLEMVRDPIEIYVGDVRLTVEQAGRLATALSEALEAVLRSQQ